MMIRIPNEIDSIGSSRVESASGGDCILINCLMKKNGRTWPLNCKKLFSKIEFIFNGLYNTAVVIGNKILQ